MQEENKKAIDNAMFKKLEDLTMKMPNDPALYKEDVEMYTQLFKKEFGLVQKDTMRKNERYGELLIFLSRCVSYFPAALGWLPAWVMSLMNQLGSSLHPFNRKKSVACIMILRAKNILYPVSTVEFLLRQCNIEDKGLRKMIYKYILNDVRRMNKHHKNNNINIQIRKFIGSYASKHGDKTSQKAIQLMIELYKRNLWNDAQTVNIIAEGCFSSLTKIKLLAAHFLIATTEKLEELEDSDEEELKNPSEIRFKKGIIKHTKNKDKKVEKEKARAERRLRKKEIFGQQKNFMPIDLIYNPQGYAEKLFNVMSHKSTKYGHKLIYMALIARLIWRHQLILLPFYAHIIKYLDPKQKDVHKVLTYFAESVHEQIPDDQIETILKHIQQHFVNDRCSEFAMTIGLNTLRAIFVKVPSIITEDMMLYLCTYYDYRNKNVCMAAKALINYVREINPKLLEKKYRGKYAGNEDNALEKSRILHTRLPGAHLLDHTSDLPIEFERILTDEDFKEIRRRVRKREKEIQDEDLQEQQQKHSRRDDEEIIQQDQLEEEEELDWEGAEQIDGNEELQDEELQDEELQDEELQDEELQGEDEEVEGSDISEASDELNLVEELEGDYIEVTDSEEEEEADQEEDEGEESAKVNQNKRGNKQKLQFESGSQSQSQDNNPHGFINVADIAFYKKSKRELKAEKKQVKETKETFKHKPKEKKGGTTNSEKRKMKPLMMLRSKKNKIRSKEKQVKTRIKSLKLQLGKVRSGKQAKRLKSKKIVKAPKRN